MQDIRNIIPFSGKGFILGGNSQSSASSATSQTHIAPVANTSSSNAIFFPKKLFAPSRQVPSNLEDKGNCNAVAGLKPPVKKSVGNSKAFVNVNGSPVKIPKPQSNTKKARQKSIEDLFGFGKPSETPAASSAIASCDSSTPDSHSSVGLKGSRGGPAEAAESEYLNQSSNGSASRKRTRDAHNNSASIFDFFQKTMSSEPSQRIKPSAEQQPAAATTGSSGPFSSTASSAPSPALMVSCPVCQAKVQESKINEHLDSCLS